MSSLRAFFSGIVDYAGLFPPAKLSMGDAVRAYAEHRSGEYRDLLGRFVVPVTRLDELAAEADTLVKDAPWQLALVASEDPAAVDRAASRFSESHSGRLAVDSIEMPVSSYDEISRAVDTFGDDTPLFLEVTGQPDPAGLVREIANTSASAKLRTGGVVESAIPSPDQVLRFLEACVEEGVPFKATAGLHHAIRGVYPLTYEPDSPTATMFGYLNIFFAAAFCAAGSSTSAVLGILEETDATAFRADERGVWWRDHIVVHEELAVVRQTVATSFGSCSFTEPVNEARALALI